MSRDKQIEIEKITDVLDKCTYDYELKDEMALMLYNAGYRKQSEVAEEIFAEIDRMIYKVLNDRHYIMGDMCYEVEELKKKYTEEGK